MQWDMPWAISFGVNTIMIVLVFLTVRLFEKRNPIEAKQDIREVIVDWKLCALKWLITQLFAPVIALWSAVLITAAGGGFIPLRTDGWWYLLSFVLLLVAVDFWGYIVHVAAHRIPVLWAMHSLHHSAEAMSMVTGARHYWLEQVTIAVFPVLWLIFKIPSEMIMPILFIYFLFGDGLVHVNMRVSFGPFTMVLNNPQYHRIHHSVEPQHWNKNFCKMFPVFDFLFGTAWRPGKDEFPKTGLVPSEKPTGFMDGLIWPLRNKLPLRAKYQTVGFP